jgi:endonuclease-3
MIRSMIGGRTYDAVAERALQRVRGRWPCPAELARADPAAVLRCLKEVTFAEDKAQHILSALRWLGRERPDYDLSFLGAWPVRDALDWLERFPGVGPKVAAATLNASTLAMPVFIVDSHVHRILQRFGFIGPRATAEQGRDAVTATALGAAEMLDLFVRLKLLGQRICRPRAPRCATCPLAARCQKRTELGRPPQEAPSFPVSVPRRMANAHFKSLSDRSRAGHSPGHRA